MASDERQIANNLAECSTGCSSLQTKKAATSCITGSLWSEYTGYQWVFADGFPSQKSSYAETI